jgi:hypothetical protein
MQLGNLEVQTRNRLAVMTDSCPHDPVIPVRCVNRNLVRISPLVVVVVLNVPEVIKLKDLALRIRGHYQLVLGHMGENIGLGNAGKIMLKLTQGSHQHRRILESLLVYQLLRNRPGLCKCLAIGVLLHQLAGEQHGDIG